MEPMFNMSLFSTDFDAWYDEYQALSPRQQHDHLKQVLSQPIDTAYALEVDLGMTVIELQCMLLDHNRSADAIEIIRLLQQHQADFYLEEFQYFDGFLVQYYLFCNDIPQVTESLKRFQAQPTQRIEYLLEALEDLQFYGAIEPLVNLCRSAYQPVASSSEFFANPEMEFSRIILIDILEKVYDRLKLGEAFDWSKLGPQIEPYGYDYTNAMQAELEQYLTCGIESDPALFAKFKSERKITLRCLLLVFCRYMYDQHQMSFVTAQIIWTLIIDFLEQRQLSAKQSATPDAYFTIQNDQLDRHLGRKLSGLLFTRESHCFAILWGIPVFYEFLLSAKIINANTHDQAIAVANALKPDLIKTFSNSLWRYSFVHHWLPTTDASKAASAQFAATFEQMQPLSEEAIEQNLFDPGVEEMPKSLNPTSGKSVQPNLTLPTWTPPKPKKSALQEAAELQAKPKTKSSAKSQRKGFG
jgi:hypothetical protein